MARPRFDARTYLRLAQITLGVCIANVVSGAAVRLSDSGLGCSNWPDCTRTQLTPPLSLHPLVEFSNRIVVVVLVLAAAACFVAALCRTPRRRDLVWLAFGLTGGVVAEAIVGAEVVYSKLNPYVVMVHFLVGMALLTVSLGLALRAGRERGAIFTATSESASRSGRGIERIVPIRGAIKVDRTTIWCGRSLLAILVLVLAAGTATTGAGPHAGGKGAKRIPVPLADMARTHSGIVLVAVILVLGLLALLHRRAAPESVQRRGRALLAVMAAQGMIGYTQYFSREPALLVGVHIAGAIAVWLTAVWWYDGLFAHRVEVDLPASTPRPASELSVTA